MSEFYTDLADTAGELLAEFGRPLTFTRSARGAFDPATGTVASTASTYTLNGVVTKFKNSEIDGERILSKDRRVLVDGRGQEPAVGDTVQIEGKSARVQDYMPLSPAGVAVMYAVQARL
ncbi:MAG: hypothetical protein AAGI72_15515 [Pseudomonadota bacterium]